MVFVRRLNRPRLDWFRHECKKDFPEVKLWCPQLPPSPADAATLMLRETGDWPTDTPEKIAVIGSSLGGFYATWFAEKFKCRAVLVNPAVFPARDLAKYIGEQTSWHNADEKFYFKPEYVDELKKLNAGDIDDPARYFAIIAKGDEVLDWREMSGRYAGAHIELLEGGDHAVSNFEDYLDAVLAFLGLSVKV